jgi:hypothetical protein
MGEKYVQPAMRVAKRFDQIARPLIGHRPGIGLRIICALDNLALAIGLRPRPAKRQNPRARFCLRRFRQVDLDRRGPITTRSIRLRVGRTRESWLKPWSDTREHHDGRGDCRSGCGRNSFHDRRVIDEIVDSVTVEQSRIRYRFDFLIWKRNFAGRDWCSTWAAKTRANSRNSVRRRGNPSLTDGNCGRFRHQGTKRKFARPSTRSRTFGAIYNVMMRKSGNRRGSSAKAVTIGQDVEEEAIRREPPARRCQYSIDAIGSRIVSEEIQRSLVPNYVWPRAS